MSIRRNASPIYLRLFCLHFGLPVPDQGMCAAAAEAGGLEKNGDLTIDGRDVADRLFGLSLKNMPAGLLPLHAPIEDVFGG